MGFFKDYFCGGRLKFIDQSMEAIALNIDRALQSYHRGDVIRSLEELKEVIEDINRLDKEYGFDMAMNGRDKYYNGLVYKAMQARYVILNGIKRL